MWGNYFYHIKLLNVQCIFLFQACNIFLLCYITIPPESTVLSLDFILAFSPYTCVSNAFVFVCEFSFFNVFHAFLRFLWESI